MAIQPSPVKADGPITGGTSFSSAPLAPDSGILRLIKGHPVFLRLWTNREKNKLRVTTPAVYDAGCTRVEVYSGDQKGEIDAWLETRGDQPKPKGQLHRLTVFDKLGYAPDGWQGGNATSEWYMMGEEFCADKSLLPFQVEHFFGN